MKRFKSRREQAALIARIRKEQSKGIDQTRITEGWDE